MGKSLLLNSACSYASSVMNKFLNSFRVCGFRLHLRIPLTFYGIYLQLRSPEQLSIFACCVIRNKLSVPTNFMLPVYVQVIQVNLVGGIHLHFETCLNSCLWNPGTYKNRIVHLSSAQFGLVMVIFS